MEFTETVYYQSPSGITVYKFSDNDLIHISGNPPQTYTQIEFDNAYDFEDYIEANYGIKMNIVDGAQLMDLNL